jgi:hypothetical protein
VVLVINPEGKKPPGRPRRKLEDNIRMVIKEMGYECLAWINPAQRRDKWRSVVNTVMNVRVQYNAETFLTG